MKNVSLKRIHLYNHGKSQFETEIIFSIDSR